MKTKKYSISMKAFTAVVFAFAFSAFLSAQFVPPAPTFTAQTAEEVRATTATTVTYDVTTNHTDGDTYRWVVRGGTITGGAVVAPDSSVLDWTLNASSITVTWDTDLSATPIGSAPGQIIVQKRVAGSCASQLQVLDITMWNPATANLDLTGLITEMCSGEALGGFVPVNLTGAPDPTADGFDVTYTIAAGTLTDLGGASVDGTGNTIQDNDELAQIPLPDGLVNPGSADETFTLTLTAVQDDFTEIGAVGTTVTYQITVHPTPETGDILSTPVSLQRR